MNFLEERLSDIPCSRVECRYYGIRFDRNCSAKVGGEAATKTCVMYRPEKETGKVRYETNKV